MPYLIKKWIHYKNKCHSFKNKYHSTGKTIYNLWIKLEISNHNYHKLKLNPRIPKAWSKNCNKKIKRFTIKIKIYMHKLKNYNKE